MRTILLFLIIHFTVLFGTTATAQQKTQRTWQTGCYYDLNGNRFIGWITREQDIDHNFDEVQNAIFFKTVEDSRGRKIPTDSIKSYVTKPDSFVVTHAPGMKRTPFIRVIVDGPVKLYDLKLTLRSQAMPPATGPAFVSVAGKSYDKVVYYYGMNPDDITQLRRSHFLKEMTEIFSQEPALLDEIKYQEYNYDNMDDILSHYFWYKRHEKANKK